MVAPPPKLDDLRYGDTLVAGMSQSTVIADFDFETYSPAGFLWNGIAQKYEKPLKAPEKGLPAIGAASYSEHPEAEVLSMAYDLKNGFGRRHWKPGNLPPYDLFNHLIGGGLLEAWNVGFERWIWLNICVPKYGWPPLPLAQLRCAAAKSRAFALPGSLDPAGTVLNIENKKLKDGKRLINKFCIPRNPTKYDARRRILPQDDPSDAENLYNYNLIDIKAEAELSSLIPDLNGFELSFWQCDQAINLRGVQVDRESIINCIKIIEQAYAKYNNELSQITNGKVKSASEVQKLCHWLIGHGVHTPTLDAENVTLLLDMPNLIASARRALEIRQTLASAAVKKPYAMLNQMTHRGRLHDLFTYHSARTGRAAGNGPQPQNLPNSGPKVSECSQCKKHFKDVRGCPWCGCIDYHRPTIEWNTSAVNDALETIATGDLACVEYFWGEALDTISGCLRGLFISAPGHDLICSDYSAIEAVVLAELAGETWQQEVFRSHGLIYEMTASKVSGIPLNEITDHRDRTGKPHPIRKLGKIASLASGYQGWIGAWKAFGADKLMSEDEIKQAILAWRKASPAIVEFWGGQTRGWKHEYYGLEGAAVKAVMSPGHWFHYRSISYIVKQDTLYCQLPSGRYLTYHRPRLTPSDRREGTVTLSFEGWNTNPKAGAIGWVRMNTYGGKLSENCTQAVARDILAHAIVNLERSGYPVVLHVHDEIVAEIPENVGSVAEFEAIMSNLPEWAAGWPVKAKGGWREKRYAK